MKSIRLSLDVTEEMNEIIEKLAWSRGVTKSEILRRAIAVLKASDAAMKRGEEVGSFKDGRVKTKFVGW